jgi:hypothetical protein
MSQLTGTFDAAEQAGISYRQINYWIRRGLIHPVGWYIRRKDGCVQVDHAGSGTHVDLDRHELRVLILMGKFTRAGLALQVAHDAARHMLDHDSEYAPLGHGVVVAIRGETP